MIQSTIKNGFYILFCLLFLSLMEISLAKATMKLNKDSGEKILTIAKIGEIAEYSLIHEVPGGNEYESIPNKQKTSLSNNNIKDTHSLQNDFNLKKVNQTDDSFSIKKMLNNVVNSVIFEVDKYYFMEDGKLNTGAVLKLSMILILFAIIIVSVIYSLKNFTFKANIPSKLNENVITLPNDDDSNKNNQGDKAKKNTISFKGRVKKVPKNINYGELFVNMESSQPKPCENNKDNILDLYENFDFTQTNNDMNKSSNEILNNSINKKPLPRSKNDLIFFEDNNEKQDVDENLEFLKEIKRNNEDKDVMRNEEDKDIKTNEEKNELKETTQNEKIISRLRNSGNFHQTEISRLNESRINDRKNSSFTKY